MSNTKLEKLVGQQITAIEPINDAKGRSTGKVFLVFSNNYKLKIKAR